MIKIKYKLIFNKKLNLFNLQNSILKQHIYMNYYLF